MTTNDIVKRLKNYKKIDKAIISLQRKLNELDNSYYPKSANFEQRITTSKVNTTENRLISIIQKKDTIIHEIMTLNDEKLAVLDLINKLSEDEEWLAITKLYVLNEDVAIICKDLRLSKTQLYRVRKQAIERLEAIR
ncbi:endonuclease [Streptococcus peroris]|uniref:endonuclease n=1 Tax=Streptococcus peroris TaxID=68891 RepID=UPI0039C0C325